jgi:subtilase family serine protease
MMLPKLVGGLLAVGIALAAFVGQPARPANAACQPWRPICLTLEPQKVLEVQGPDLIPVSIQAERGRGNDIRVTATLKNRGDTTASVGSWTWVAINGQVESGQLWAEGAIAPGAVVTHVFTKSMPVGLCTAAGVCSAVFQMKVDDGNTVRESNESNNHLSVTLRY